MIGASQWRVPESVLRFVDARLDVLNCWPSQPEHTTGNLLDCMDRCMYLSAKDSLFRFMMKIINGSPAAIRACEKFDRGEIDGDQLLKMMD